MRRCLLVLLLFGLFFLAHPAQASAATMYFSPTAGTKYVGSSFTVAVLVDTGGTAANSFQADVRFPSDKLEVSSISTGGSVCTLFPFQPSYGTGTAQIQCGLPSPGYNGSGGKLGTITFTAKLSGTATVSLAPSSQILANDGQGTNITSSLGNATFTIANPPTSVPTVTSTTHPSEAGWYKGTTVTLNWTGGYSGYSYEFNQSADANPDTSSEGAATSKTYDGVKEGVWYFSLRGLGSSGWSGVVHFRVQIDTTPPNPFTPLTDPVGETDVRPLISFATTDALSGIDHYELKLDKGEFFRAENPYRPDRISSGERTFLVRALDKAGNYTDASVKIRVKEIASPTIVSPSGGLLKFLEKMIIQGTGPIDSSITVFLNDKVIGQEIVVGKDGKWSYTYDQILFPGGYKLYAVVTKDGIDSRPSNEVNFTVDAAVVSLGPLTLPAGLVILILLVLLAVAVGLASYFFLKVGRRVYLTAGRIRERLRGLREEVSEDMTKLEHNVEGDIESTLQGKNSGELRSMEHTLEGKVEEDIERTKGHLKGDIEAAENDVKGP